MFYPAHEPDSVTQPRGGSAQHLRGFWIPAGRLHSLQASVCAPLARHQWFAERSASEHSPLHGCADFAATGVGEPQCIALFDGERERTRGFVVPDDWGKSQEP